MDSTHKTNKHSWKLYALLVRDTFGSLLSGGHFFVSAEEQHIVAKGLQVLKRWARTWEPRYFLTDQSAIEKNAVKHTFLGLEAGEQESPYSTALSIVGGRFNGSSRASARDTT